MNVNKIVANGVETAFRILKDLVSLGTVQIALSGSGSGTYDPVTGTTTTPIKVIDDVRMIITSVEPEELVGTQVVITDIKILIPAKDLKGSTPRASDHIFVKGMRYNITRPKPVPGEALWILYCRQA